jgi:cell division protein FtsW (lipid II flippase)
METQATEQPNPQEIRQTAHSFFRRHQFYCFGLLSGFGFGMFAVEAFRQEKNPVLYICGLLVCVLGRVLYRRSKDYRKR